MSGNVGQSGAAEQASRPVLRLGPLYGKQCALRRFPLRLRHTLISRSAPRLERRKRRLLHPESAPRRVLLPLRRELRARRGAALGVFDLLVLALPSPSWLTALAAFGR